MARPLRVSTPTTKAFAERLSDLVQIKKDEGLSHDEISRQIGVSSGVLSEWMSDNKTASIENLAKLAKYFNVSADYLLGRTDVKTSNMNVKAICEYLGLNESTIFKLHNMQNNVFGFSSVKFFIDTLIDVRSASILEDSIREAVISRWSYENTPAENSGPISLDELRNLSLNEYEARLNQIKLGCQHMKDQRLSIMQEGVGVVLSFDDAEAFFIERATAFLHAVIYSCTYVIADKYRPESK